MPPSLSTVLRPKPPTLSPFDIAALSTRRSALRNDYRRNTARVDFNIGQAETKYANDFGSLTQRYSTMRNRFPGGYAQRGLLNSGIYKRGLTDFHNQRTQDFGNLAVNLQSQLAGFQQQRLDYANQLRQGLMSTRADALARRAQLATQLRSVTA